MESLSKWSSKWFCRRQVCTIIKMRVSLRNVEIQEQCCPRVLNKFFGGIEKKLPAKSFTINGHVVQIYQNRIHFSNEANTLKITFISFSHLIAPTSPQVLCEHVNRVWQESQLSRQSWDQAAQKIGLRFLDDIPPL